MKTLYLDCGMGAAGDMLTAALLELYDDPSQALAELNAMGIPGVTYLAEPAVKCGITGTHMHVLVNGEEEEEFHNHHHHHDHDEHSHTHEHEEHHAHHEHHEHHHHTGMDEIRHLIAHLHVSEGVRSQIEQVYGVIAQAESHVHGQSVEQIHFHEVGSMDAVADVAAVCYLLEKLGVQQIVASPVHVGSGQVHCAHGILPVPAPATAHILQGVPIYGGEIRGELCTPTGAALLKRFVTSFGAMPVMTVEKNGYGMGKKDFPAANCVRAMLGSTATQGDKIVSLSCNLDDTTGETLGFAMERLFDAGAVDVFTQPIGMKKSRPGVMLTALCRVQDREAVVAALFRHTTTLGVRETEHRRYTLERREETVQTPYGPVRKKISQGYGVTREKYEYDDLSRIAFQEDLTLAQVREEIAKA